MASKFKIQKRIDPASPSSIRWIEVFTGQQKQIQAKLPKLQHLQWVQEVRKTPKKLEVTKLYMLISRKVAGHKQTSIRNSILIRQGSEQLQSTQFTIRESSKLEKWIFRTACSPSNGNQNLKSIVFTIIESKQKWVFAYNL